MSTPLSLTARGLDTIAARLDTMGGYRANVTYSITLPQAMDDVVYCVELQQPGGGDSYVIDWSVDTPSGPEHGFTAWFPGHFYALRGHRLREEHAGWTPQGVGRPSWRTAQFAALTPTVMAADLRDMAADPERYDVTVSSRGSSTVVDARRKAGDEVDAELQWVFDTTTGRPLLFTADYNPGAISGQQVRAAYAEPQTPAIVGELTEELLRERYPEAFATMRESNFAIESMRGRPLPAFSLPLVGGSGRFSRQGGERFSEPTAVVLLDAESALAPQLVSAVRGAVSRLPIAANVIWACVGPDPESATELLTPPGADETALFAARSLAADCGAAALPVVMVCGTDGKVADIIIGLNQTTETDVIRMLSTVK